MEQEKAGPKGPYPIIDYREILKRKEEEEKLAKILLEPTGESKKNTHFGFANFWRTADRKVKAEIIISAAALAIALFLLVAMFAQMGNARNETNIAAPPAEENWNKTLAPR